MHCRHCEAPLALPLVDLGSAPPSNAYLRQEDLNKPERWYPLRVLVCSRCWLAQTEDYAGAEEIFTDEYAYFSSFSTTWLRHAQTYVAAVVNRFHLTRASLVVELAANDGYLLQYVMALGIPCVGVEPTASTANSARSKGIHVIQEFFGKSLAEEIARQRGQADLIVANNVLAHVPDINDFVRGVTILLKPTGVATFEFQHVMNLVSRNQVDTIYHEHYSYLSLIAVRSIVERNGLRLFDVEEVPTHGGSLRVYVQRAEGRQPCAKTVEALIERERQSGLASEDYYSRFQTRSESIKNAFLTFLLEAARKGKDAVAYGAAAKGNTLLNFAGVRRDLLRYVVDRNPAKQGKFLPGSRIPIVDEKRIREDRPDYIVVLPWNIRDEVAADLSYVRAWGGQFVSAIPELCIS